ncbi:MAG: hypothetical protein AB7G25_01065 [Sphingomonadaceae bacterium]
MRLALSLLLLAATPASASDEAEFDPADVSIVDAINCHVDVPTYNGFAMAIGSEDNLASRLGWRKVPGENPFLAEYELPEPVLVTGTWSTRRIAFSASGVMAILDVADPMVVATGEEIRNELETDAAIAEIVNAAVRAGVASRAEVESGIALRKFLGQRVLVDVTEHATEPDGFGTHTVIARSISNVSSHPGKTLYGCSYKIELLGRDGKPL